MIARRLAMASAVLLGVTPALSLPNGHEVVGLKANHDVAAGDAACHVTQSQYEQLRINMTIDEVRKIFQCTGELKRSSDKFGTRYDLYLYAGSREGSGVFADFQNSRLLDKVNVDLD